MNVTISKNFKRQTKKTIYSIIIFMIVYVLLLILAIGITLGLSALGIGLIIFKPMLITLGIGLGLIAAGFTVLIFLVKFIFSSTKTDISDLREITAHDQPKIFQIISDIVKEVGTAMPKKVYISADVNASVFYDSSFWSMFLPIRKNLIIGIGLMNSVSEQEFKAILAHEFGHFSQKSMKVGSYVYNVNRIIYNMLYKNESLDKMIQKGANISGYLVLFMGVSVFIIKQIQTILTKMYDYININYMALSREMEFHADAIAAHVAGSQHLSEALLRLEFANYSLNNTIEFYNNHKNSDYKSQNIYNEHTQVMNFLAVKNKYQLNNGFAKITIDHLKKYNTSKINIENQWASHPSVEDRSKALEALNIVVNNTKDLPAIELLENREQLISQLTQDIFQTQANNNIDKKTISDQLFIENYKAQFEDMTFDDIFNNYYDYTNPIIHDFSEPEENKNLPSSNVLFSDEFTNKSFELNSLKEDISLLEYIQNGDIKIKTFDYNGKKHNKNNASDIIITIKNQIQILEHDIDKHNQTVYHHFINLEKNLNKSPQIITAYIEFAYFNKKYEEKTELFLRLHNDTQFIFQSAGFHTIEDNLKKIEESENELKIELKELSSQINIEEELGKSIKDDLDTYVNKELVYFHVDQYDDNNVNLLFTAMHNYLFLLKRLYFIKKKNILNIQKNLMRIESLN